MFAFSGDCGEFIPSCDRPLGLSVVRWSNDARAVHQAGVRLFLEPFLICAIGFQESCALLHANHYCHALSPFIRLESIEE
jgi:hypothetical protein